MIKEEIQRLGERFTSSQIKKAIGIAKQMSGNMTGAAKKIEKLKKGLSQDSEVKDALKTANESINEANFRQGDKFELGKDLDYGDEKLHAGNYEVVRAKGPHQYQLKDTHSGKQYTLHKKDFEKYTKKKQFKQINEGNPTPAVQKKLIKIFQNDPLYKDVIMATNSKQMQKALGTLRSIRGPNAIKLLKKHSKKLMGKDY